MATTKADILTALSKLDHTDPTQWTDDGSPRMEMIQKLAGDPKLTRALVNEAAPGFARKDPDAPEAEAEVEVEAEVTAQAGDEPFDDTMEPEVDGPGEQLSEDEVKAILLRRIRDADANLEAARRATAEARNKERKCEQRADRARLDHNRRFPPVSAAENIQQHLKRQQELLMERVTGAGGYGRGQLDQAMEKRNSRGWSRPSRPVQNTTAA